MMLLIEKSQVDDQRIQILVAEGIEKFKAGNADGSILYLDRGVNF